jgi:uncharacterized phage-associated protein
MSTETTDREKTGDPAAWVSPADVRRARLGPEARALAAEVGLRIDFRNRLRDLRRSLRLTQGEVARIVGEDQSDISRFERGLGNPTLERMERILGPLEAYAVEVHRTAVMPGVWRSEPLLAAQTAAQYFCAIRDEEDSFTNLKLQKLLYYAQGYATVLLGRPLFGERIKAWTHGPVVPQVRYEYKENRSSPLPRPDGFDPAEVELAARAVLDRVYVELGPFEAWHLREMTHSEGPWASTKQGEEITVDAIREYFATRIDPLVETGRAHRPSEPRSVVSS